MAGDENMRAKLRVAPLTRQKSAPQTELYGAEDACSLLGAAGGVVSPVHSGVRRGERRKGQYLLFTNPKHDGRARTVNAVSADITALDVLWDWIYSFRRRFVLLSMDQEGRSSRHEERWR